MQKLLIKNIKELVQVEENPKSVVKGSAMSELPTIKNAWLAVENDTIVDFGKMDDWPGITDWSNLKVIDASNKIILPTWCDSHTHIVFAGTRETEFVDRINGLSYEEIAKRGGGILNSAKKLAQTSEEELFTSALSRINDVIKLGTGAIEIKSGYGLSVEAELKILRVIKKLKEHTDVEIKSTFLGAHAFPTEYKNNHSGYIDLIINEMLPVIAKEQLADYIDVFCEKNYFSVEETEQILAAGLELGLKPKVHVNQFNSIGGIEACTKFKAVSVDHLEIVEEKDILALKKSNTIATLLPSCSFFINIPYAPAKKLIANNIPIALATDYNPGSTPSGNMNFVISLACIQQKLTPEQAINAATINGAAAMELNDVLGSIARGKKANFFITKEISSYAFIPYNFSHNNIESVFLNGNLVS